MYINLNIKRIVWVEAYIFSKRIKLMKNKIRAGDIYGKSSNKRWVLC